MVIVYFPFVLVYGFKSNMYIYESNENWVAKEMIVV